MENKFNVVLFRRVALFLDDVDDIYSLATTCRDATEACDDDLIWRPIYEHCCMDCDTAYLKMLMFKRGSVMSQTQKNELNKKLEDRISRAYAKERLDYKHRVTMTTAASSSNARDDDHDDDKTQKQQREEHEADDEKNIQPRSFESLVRDCGPPASKKRSLHNPHAVEEFIEAVDDQLATIVFSCKFFLLYRLRAVMWADCDYFESLRTEKNIERDLSRLRNPRFSNKDFYDAPLRTAQRPRMSVAALMLSHLGTMSNRFATTHNIREAGRRKALMEGGRAAYRSDLDLRVQESARHYYLMMEYNTAAAQQQQRKKSQQHEKQGNEHNEAPGGGGMQLRQNLPPSPPPDRATFAEKFNFPVKCEPSTSRLVSGWCNRLDAHLFALYPATEVLAYDPLLNWKMQMTVFGGRWLISVFLAGLYRIPGVSLVTLFSRAFGSSDDFANWMEELVQSNKALMMDMPRTTANDGNSNNNNTSSSVLSALMSLFPNPGHVISECLRLQTAMPNYAGATDAGQRQKKHAVATVVTVIDHATNRSTTSGVSHTKNATLREIASGLRSAFVEAFLPTPASLRNAALTVVSAITQIPAEVHASIFETKNLPLTLLVCSSSLLSSLGIAGGGGRPPCLKDCPKKLRRSFLMHRLLSEVATVLSDTMLDWMFLFFAALAQMQYLVFEVAVVDRLPWTFHGFASLAHVVQSSAVLQAPLSFLRKLTWFILGVDDAAHNKSSSQPQQHVLAIFCFWACVTYHTVITWRNLARAEREHKLDVEYCINPDSELESKEVEAATDSDDDDDDKQSKTKKGGHDPKTCTLANCHCNDPRPKVAVRTVVPSRTSMQLATTTFFATAMCLLRWRFYFEERSLFRILGTGVVIRVGTTLVEYVMSNAF